MLSIKNLKARVANTEDAHILKGIDLEVAAGEICAIMGPNGSGKSTLANVVAGKPEYEVTDGEIIFNGEDIVDTAPDVRSHKGLFMAFQYPPEIPGVKPWQFLKAALDGRAEVLDEPKLSVRDFSKKFEDAAKQAGLSRDLVQRSLNEGFSGGEKKRAEVLQMLVLEPKLLVLDETDSGLDVDALKLVAEAINSMRSKNRSFLVVTHYHRILQHINPDKVHVLMDGRIVRSGGPDLAIEIEEKGYEAITLASR